MPRRFAAWRAVSLLTLSAALSMVVGCASYDTYMKTSGNDTREIDVVTAEAENPVPEIYPAAYSAAPITSKSLRDGQEIQYRDVTVGEVLRLALENSEVLRELGGTILRTPETIRTRYSTGLQQTDPRFGTHAALSAFDTQFKGTATLFKNDRIYNNSFFAGGINAYDQDLHEYKSELSKRAATGALMIFRNVSDMDANNAPGNLFPHAWNFYSEVEARQPLLQGGGLQYNRIAGPAGAPGLYNGILIARVNVDVTQTDFEIAVRDYISNVVNVYWDLYYSYRDLDARRRAMHAALESWRKIKAQVEAEGLSASKEAQAREQYYRFKQEVDDSLSGRLLQGTQTRNGTTGGTLRANGGVQVNERRLRYMIGLPITDGTLLRPSQDPDEAEVIYDWEILMQESLARRPELRRQQLKVKRREMELLAAQNFIIPQLDAIARYRFRGFGNSLIDYSGNQGGGKPSSAIGNLGTFNHQEWMAGVEFSMPIGFRQGHAAVANAEIALCHERAIHREQEREIIHDLSNALSDAVRAFESCQSSLNRYIASREVLLSLEAEEKNGLPIDIDRILDAQRRVVEAEIRYYQSRTEYAVAQKNVQLERGALAGENDLMLIDGIDSSASEQAPIVVPNKVPPAPAPADDNAKPIPPDDAAKRTTSQNENSNASRPSTAAAATLAENIVEESDQEAGRLTATSKMASSLVKKANADAETEEAARIRQRAMTTLQQARQDLQAGRIDEARQKALAAQKLDASYELWDDRPETLLAEIDRLSQSQMLVQPKKTDFNNLKAQATALLKDARADLAAGRISDAQEKATQASELNVAYGVFDDRPESVLADIQQAARNTAKKSKSPAENAVKNSTAKNNDSKAQATALLKSARADLAAGRISEAQEKATQASELNVAYGVFDDRPETVMADIQQAARNTAKKSKSPAENAVKSPTAKPNDSKTQATALLESARADLAAGRVSEAQEKATQASELNVAYGVFDDRPETVLADIQQAARNTAEKSKPSTEEIAKSPTAKPNDSKTQATALLKSARADLAAGRVSEAQEKATQASELNVAYGVFDDRPESVLADIQHASRNTAKKSKQSIEDVLKNSTAKPNDAKSQATALLKDARADLAAGRVAQAQEKAAQASELDVAYGVFDDRPESVLADIQQSSRNTAKKSKQSIEDVLKSSTARHNESKAHAAALLKSARADLAAGRVADAQEKATQASELNVAYGVFDDRPESVLADIQQSTRNTAAKTKSPAPNAAKRFPAQRTVQPTSAKVNELPEFEVEDSQPDAADDQTIFAPSVREPAKFLRTPPASDEDDASTMSLQQKLRDMRLEPSIFNDDDEDDEMSDEFWDK